MNLNIETAPLDETSKALLRKLIAAGHCKSGVTYVVGPEVASADELSSLIQRWYTSVTTVVGGLSIGIPVFELFTAPNFGRDEGKIRLRLNFDLTSEGIPLLDNAKKARDGTSEIAERFGAIAIESTVSFTAPAEVLPNWLPAGYELITDPEHILRADDALLPALSNDWRLIADVNGGARIGLCARDVGNDIRHVAKLVPTSRTLNRQSGGGCSAG